MQVDPPALQTRGSLPALIAFCFCLGLKNVQSSLEVSPSRSPVSQPGDREQGERCGDPQAHPLLTKAHNKLSFKEQGET